MSGTKQLRVFFSSLCILGLAACSDSSEDEGATSKTEESSKEVAAADRSSTDGTPAKNPKLHPVKQFTIVYELSGMDTGTLTHHSKDWGYHQVQIKDASMSVMGISQVTKERLITKGREITTINLATNTGMRIDNPMYDNLAQAFDGKDPMEVGEDFMTAMGGVKTGDTREIAGETCDVWTIAQMGAEQCVTQDGLTLAMDVNMMGMQMKQVATSVSRKNGGPKDAYEVGEDVTISETALPTLPDGTQMDLEAIMNGTGQEQQTTP